MDDRTCMEAMVAHGNLSITAWNNSKLIGIACSITDFTYACYLSELAVDMQYQNKGIGKALVLKTREQLGPHCKVRLVSAPGANDYYPKIGFTRNDRSWEFG